MPVGFPSPIFSEPHELSERTRHRLLKFDPAQDAYNKRTVQEARVLLRNKSPEVSSRGKIYKAAPGHHLYVFSAREAPVIKIGRSRDVCGRIHTVERELKLNLEPLLILSDKGHLEHAVHHIFWDHRVTGEWFSWELTLKRWVEEMRKQKFAVVTTRQELAAQLEARRLAEVASRA